MKVVFCGTPEFAVPTFEAVLDAGHDVQMAVTQPDRAAGRGMEVQAPPIKKTALARGVPVVQPEKIKNNPEFRERLEALQPDAILVVAYGRIIPSWMLALPRLGNINLHGSLLPKYRGAAPVQWAIANGETVTGVTTMRLDPGLDTGEMLLARAVPIAPEETAPDVFRALAAIGAELMVETLAGLAANAITPQPQDHAHATLAPILSREDGQIDFRRTSKQIFDRWRGFQPWPGAYTTLRGKKLIFHRMHPDSTGELPGEPGTLHIRGQAFAVTCAEGCSITVEEVQLEGKRRMSATEFLRGFQVRSGERLGH